MPRQQFVLGIQAFTCGFSIPLEEPELPSGFCFCEEEKNAPSKLYGVLSILHVNRHQKLKKWAVSEVWFRMMAREEGKPAALGWKKKSRDSLCCVRWHNLYMFCYTARKKDFLPLFLSSFNFSLTSSYWLICLLGQRAPVMQTARCMEKKPWGYTPVFLRWFLYYQMMHMDRITLVKEMSFHC